MERIFLLPDKFHYFKTGHYIERKSDAIRDSIMRLRLEREGERGREREREGGRERERWNREGEKTTLKKVGSSRERKNSDRIWEKRLNNER
jgi:hypothetical protein